MRTLIAAAALMLPLTTLAQEEEFEPGGYVMAHAGQSRFDVDHVPYEAANRALLEDLDLTPSTYSSSLDDADVAFGATLGYRFSQYAGIEAGYVMLGEATDRARANVTAAGAASSTTAGISTGLRVKGATLGLAAFVPIGARFDIHARGGVFFAQSRVEVGVTIASTTDADHGTGHSRDGYYSYGIGYRLYRGLEATVDYTHYRNVGDRSETIERTISLIGAGLIYRF